VYQFEILLQPPRERALPSWPMWPLILRASAAHEEGGVRDWSIRTGGFSGTAGAVEKLHAERVAWKDGAAGRLTPQAIPNSAFAIECDLCLVALGFLHPEHDGMLGQLGVALDGRGNVRAAANYMTSVPGVFVAGDMRRGQSLLVWALAEGRQAAAGVSAWLREDRAS